MELTFKLIGINIEVAASAVLKEGHGSAQICQTVSSLRQQFIRMSEPRNVLDSRRQFRDARLQDNINERRQEIIGSSIMSALCSALQQRSERSACLDNALQLPLTPPPVCHLLSRRPDILNLLQLLGDGVHRVRVLFAHIRDLEVVRGEELEIPHLVLEFLVLLREIFAHFSQRQLAKLLQNHLLDAVSRVYSPLLPAPHSSARSRRRSSTPCASGSPPSARP